MLADGRGKPESFRGRAKGEEVIAAGIDENCERVLLAQELGLLRGEHAELLRHVALPVQVEPSQRLAEPVEVLDDDREVRAWRGNTGVAGDGRKRVGRFASVTNGPFVRYGAALPGYRLAVPPLGSHPGPQAASEVFQADGGRHVP